MEKPGLQERDEAGWRCLIPADGYYEWRLPKAPASGLTSFYSRDRRACSALRGLAMTWIVPEGEELDTAAIVTAPQAPISRAA